MSLSGVKYFSAVSTNKRFTIQQKHEESRIDAMKRKMLGRVWKEKENLLNDFIRINVRTAKGLDRSGNIELKEMAVDPRLVLPMDLNTISMRNQTVISPVITVDGRAATLYPKKGAKHGRNIVLSAKVYERMHKARSISTVLEQISTGARRQDMIDSLDVTSGGSRRIDGIAPSRYLPRMNTAMSIHRLRGHPTTAVTVGDSTNSTSKGNVLANEKRGLPTLTSNFGLQRAKSAPEYCRRSKGGTFIQ